MFSFLFCLLFIWVEARRPKAPVLFEDHGRLQGSLLAERARSLNQTCDGFSHGDAGSGTPPEVVIGIITNGKNHAAASSQGSWFRRTLEQMHNSSFASSLRTVFFSNQLLEGEESWYEDDPLSTYATAQERYIEAIHLMAMDCSGYKSSLRWFMLIDDDALVHPRQLQTLLLALEQRVNPREDAYVLGRQAAWTEGTIFGGNGMLFSQGALNVLSHAASDKWAKTSVPKSVKDVIHGALGLIDGMSNLYHYFLGDKVYFEPRIQSLIDDNGVATIHTVLLTCCFGMNFDKKLQDEVYYAERLPDWQSKTEGLWKLGDTTDLTVSLHKIKDEDDYNFADSLFSKCDATVEDFKRHLNL